MQKSSRSVSFSEKDKKIVFNLSNTHFLAFRRHITHDEVYVPFSDFWKRKLPNGTESNKKPFNDFDVVVRNADNPTVFLIMKCYHTSIRHVPIRPFERAGKHIALHLTPQI